MKENSRVLFTCIVALDRQKEAKKLFDHIFSGGVPADEIQVIAVTAHKDHKVECSAWYEEQIEVIVRKGKSLYDLYQAAKGRIKGTYISFLDEKVCYAEGTLSFVKQEVLTKKTALYSVRPIYIDSYGEERAYPIAPENSRSYSKITGRTQMQFYYQAFFIKKSLFKKCTIRQEAGYEQGQDLILQAILKNQGYDYSSQYSLYYFEPSENEFSNNKLQYQKKWYLEELDTMILHWLRQAQEYEDTEQRAFIEKCMMYLFSVRFSCNINDRNKKVLNEEELEQFREKAKEICNYLPEKVLLLKERTGKYGIPRTLKMFLLDLKEESQEEKYTRKILKDGLYIEETGNSEEKFRTLCEIGKLKAEKIEILAINYLNGKLEIDARSTAAEIIDHQQVRLEVLYDNEEFACSRLECYPLLKLFGRTYAKKYLFHVSIPVKKEKKSSNISFRIWVNGKKYQQKVTFSGQCSRLVRAFKKSYWQFEKNYILVHNGTNRLSIRQVSDFRIWGREQKLRLEMYQKARKQKDNKELKQAIWLRILLHVMRHIYGNRRIWISFDKLYKAGDNGEYMYHYLKEEQDKIIPYYIVNEDSPDYRRLKEAGENVLIAKSLKCRLMCLQAEVILATHTTIWAYCGFNRQQQMYLRDLFDAKLVCIQHGLTVQKIAQYQNRLFDNTQFYCCASQIEVDNILKPIYGYEPENIAVTGLARYDGLKNQDKKQILITPTWRRDIVNNGIAFIKKTHNPNFKHSAYYHVYNDLINNQRFIETARKYGYRIIYLLHPAMSAQAKDFETNGYVEIMEAAGDMSYEKILTESSLMVTDYSGVQFDFAYMRKPILYYHPDLLPPFYEEGVFQYDTMGFGDICRQEEQLVDRLCAYMEKQCCCEAYYKERADQFFAYADHNSCERIYRAVEKFLERDDERKKVELEYTKQISR